MFYFVPLKVRFLAMTMSEQARHCSLGLTKTLVCNGLVHRGRFAGVGKSGFSCPPPSLFAPCCYQCCACLQRRVAWVCRQCRCLLRLSLFWCIFLTVCFGAVAQPSFYGCGLIRMRLSVYSFRVAFGDKSLRSLL